MTSDANTSGEDGSATAAQPAPQAAKSEKEATADELAAPPEAVNMTDEEEMGAANSKDNSESGKLKALFGILKRMVGVKDLAAIRLSLPANLLEPVPNLEYWNYLDRGDLFTTVGDFDDPLDRMLATLRFTFTKELKFVHGKICKPYNSILGEHFRCHWDVVPPEMREDGSLLPKMNLLTESPSAMPQAGTSVASTPSLTSKKTKRQERKGGGSATTSESGTDRPAVARGQSGVSNSSSSGAPTMSSLSAITTSNSTDDGSSSGRPSAKRGLSKFLSAASGRNKASSRSSVHSSKTNSPTTPSKSAADTADDVSKMTLDGSAGGGEKGDKEGDENGEGDDDDDDDDDDESVGGSFKTSKSTAEVGKRRICFLTEQVSHHPPISSFFVECKEAGIQLYGVDQLSAKFTGTTIRIFPGDQNQGIFIKLTDDCKSGAVGEEYQITHPTASINGLLRGSLWVAICDTLYITCRGGTRKGESDDGKKGPRLRTIVEYKDESWVLKAKYALEAVIYEYDEAQGQDADEFDKIRQVPQERIIATMEGTWKGQITWRRKGEKESKLLIDLDQLLPIDTRGVRPLASQEPMESRKIWEPVTNAIHNKEFGAATKHKQDIEQMQRDKAAERKRNGSDFVPRFFLADISDGRPKLTEAGQKALDGEAQLEGYSTEA